MHPGPHQPVPPRTPPPTQHTHTHALTHTHIHYVPRAPPSTPHPTPTRQAHGFWGILLLAAYPNAAFDLCGICCGHFQMPFWEFFGATLIGKGGIKARLCGRLRPH